MTEDQVHEWAQAGTPEFRAEFTRLIQAAHKADADFCAAHSAGGARPGGGWRITDEARAAFGARRQCDDEARDYLTRGLHAHGIDVHPDVLSLYMIQVIAGDRALVIP